MTKNILTITILTIFLATPLLVMGQDVSSDAGLTPDSPFYFLKTWKERIQLFFTFGAENKAEQYLHLSEIRLAEYQKMLEKGKTKIAEKTLEKYENQLDRALQKIEELKDKGKDIKALLEKAEQSSEQRIEVLQRNLEKAPEQAKEGLQRAIENTQNKMERIRERIQEKGICENKCGDGVCQEIVCMGEGCPCAETKENCSQDCPTPTSTPDSTAGWKTYRNEKMGIEFKYPPAFTLNTSPNQYWKNAYRDSVGTDYSYRFFELVDTQRGCYIGSALPSGVTDPNWEGKITTKYINSSNGRKISVQYWSFPDNGTYRIFIVSPEILLSEEEYMLAFNLYSLSYQMIISDYKNTSFGKFINESCIKDFETILTTFKFIK